MAHSVRRSGLAAPSRLTDWRGEGEEAGLGSGPAGPLGPGERRAAAGEREAACCSTACVPLLKELSTRLLSGNKFQVTKSCFLLMNHLSPFCSSMT